MSIESLIAREFSRNIGLMSEEEQKILLNSRVAIGGCGGVGGIHALTLARLGIGKFVLADKDTYGPENISRQFGAFHSTVDKQKASVIEEMIKDINPEAETQVFGGGVTPQNVTTFLQGADLYIDGIDFFQFDARRMIFQEAHRQGIFAMTSAPLGFGATLQIFSPKGMTFDEYFGINEKMTQKQKLASFTAGIAPWPYHMKYLDRSKIDLKNEKGPAVAPACTLAASLIGTAAVKVLTGKAPVAVIPHYIQHDMLRGKYKRGYLFMGGKNPLHKLKSFIIHRILLNAEKQSH